MNPLIPPSCHKDQPAHFPSPLTDQLPETRVLLRYVAKRLNLYLRFGHPARELIVDPGRGCAVFRPGARFARIHWQANAFGTTYWQMLVLQACAAHEPIVRISGIQPGANILLRAEGEHQLTAILREIDAIEALNIDPADVSPAYWRVANNRLAAYLPLPIYTAERHAAWMSRGSL